MNNPTVQKTAKDHLKEEFRSYLRKLKSGFSINCFTILNTAKKIDKFYFTPVRSLDNMQVCGVVVANSIEAKAFARLSDGKFDYIAVDSEKKIEPSRYSYPDDLGNIEGEVLDNVKKSKVINFKANDITVEAVDIFVANKLLGVPQKKIAIVGLGNIGFKLAIKFVERGCFVNMFRRNRKKLNSLADTINLIKPKGTLAKVVSCGSLRECLRGVHVVVATADTSHIVSLNDLKATSDNPLLIDCGKGCFCDDVCVSRIVYRTDIGIALLHYLKMIILSNDVLYPRFGKRELKGKTYICGVSGSKGDIILSDINDLSSVIGVCDGHGGMISAAD